MRSGKIRKMLKTASPTASVAKYGDTSITVRVTSFLDVAKVVAFLEEQGLYVCRQKDGRVAVEIVGSQRNPDWAIVAFPKEA